jgi:hypothetical protein
VTRIRYAVDLLELPADERECNRIAIILAERFGRKSSAILRLLMRGGRISTPMSLEDAVQLESLCHRLGLKVAICAV